ncbi:hypothetical protein AAZX31_09G183000 [Glycine max]|nr:hypothetical protein JHK85_026296 [Glycine max]KAG5013545.1 hypothetical protein JHK86_025806 [Glycine max]
MDHEYEISLCKLCIKFIRKNKRVAFRWKDINQEFEVIINHMSLQNIEEKFLKFEETDLGWDPTIRKFSGLNEWWGKKIKNQLFKDSYATGENVIAPSMDPKVDEVLEYENINGEEGDKKIDRKNTHYERDRGIVYREYNQYVYQAKDLLNKHIFFA